MMRTILGVAAAIAVAAMATPAQAQAPSGGSAFGVRTVADLGALCGARAGEPSAEAATYLCHGFLVGVGQYHAATRLPGTPTPPLFCPPSPPPSLNTVAAGFAAWARANPAFAGERAVDGVVRWARATYPCPAAAPSRAR